MVEVVTEGLFLDGGGGGESGGWGTPLGLEGAFWHPVGEGERRGIWVRRRDILRSHFFFLSLSLFLGGS